jgi:ATP-dependent Clp protease adaptor protein ClpS
MLGKHPERAYILRIKKFPQKTFPSHFLVMIPFKKTAQNTHNPYGGNKTFAATQTLVRPKKPALYKVLMLNDDYTPMDFVVFVVQKFFNKTLEEATAIMVQVHTTGVGMCGVYTLEVAETKVAQVRDFGAQHLHPLQCTLEKE